MLGSFENSGFGHGERSFSFLQRKGGKRTNHECLFSIESDVIRNFTKYNRALIYIKLCIEQKLLNRTEEEEERDLLQTAMGWFG